VTIQMLSACSLCNTAQVYGGSFYLYLIYMYIFSVQQEIAAACISSVLLEFLFVNIQHFVFLSDEYFLAVSGDSTILKTTREIVTQQVGPLLHENI